jgi:hypothetical protein
MLKAFEKSLSKIHDQGFRCENQNFTLQIIKSGKDFFRDSQKSPNVAILENSHVVKSITYVSEKNRFKVFQQSLLYSAG